MDAIRLQNRRIRVSVVAAAGGKIVELVDVQTGRNWLWENPVLPVRHARYDVDYRSELDSGGWDEVLLSITPAKFTALDGSIVNVPDHGDVVGQQWVVDRVEETAEGDAQCLMSVDGRAANYRFSRTLCVRDMSSELEIHYQLENREPFALPFYWAAHPLLNVTPTTRIGLEGTPQFKVDSFQSKSMVAEVESGRWPNLQIKSNKPFDLSGAYSSCAPGANFASKLFVRSSDLTSPVVRLEDGSESLRFQYDAAVVPWLGLWMNNGAWHGAGNKPYRNLGIEPTTVPFDNVKSAIDAESVPFIAAGDTVSWSLRIGVSS